MIEIQVGMLARRLNVHRNTVSNWIRSGKLKAARTVGKRYRIQETDWIRFCREYGLSETVCQAALKRPGRSETPRSAGHGPPSTSHERGAYV